MAKKVLKGNNKGIMIASAIAAAIVLILVVIGIILMEDNKPSNATLEDVSVNVLGELVLEMSDGSIVVAGSLPRNAEGIKMVSAHVQTGVDGFEEEGYRTVMVTCVDNNGVDYEKILKFPIFGEGHSLISARMNEDGCVIFDTTKGEENGGKILYPSMPKNPLTPNGTSPLRPEGGAPATAARVRITVKGYGAITLAIDYAAAPKTAAAFIKLVEDGYYDGLTFNKIVDESNYGYILAGIAGGAADSIKGEFSDNGYDNPLELKEGALVLYHPDSDMDGGSSQFFICTEDSTALNGEYAVFGYVLNGMNIVREIANLTKTFSESENVRPSEIEKYRNKQAVIESVVITKYATVE